METRGLTTHEDVLDFLEEFCTFSPTRTYMLFAMARPKENPALEDTKLIREIVTHEGKLEQKLRTLDALTDVYEADSQSLDFRLYVTMNARNVNDAFSHFQKNLIDMQHDIADGDEKTQEFAKRLDEEWKTVLHSEGNKDDNYFLIDIDSKDDDRVQETYDSLQSETDIVVAIETPNGYHIVCEPFDYKGWEGLDWSEESEINTDDLLFLSFL